MMRKVDVIRLAIQDLQGRKLRSFFTISSIVVSLMMLMTLIPLGIGIRNMVLVDLANDISLTQIDVRPDTRSQNISSNLPLVDQNKRLTLSATNFKKIVARDIEEIANLQDVDNVLAWLFTYTKKVQLNSHTLDSHSLRILGIDLNNLELPQIYAENGSSKNSWVDYGRFLVKDDTDVAVVGTNWLRLMGITDFNAILEQDLTITCQSVQATVEPIEVTLKVVGIFPDDKFLGHFRDSIIVPIEVAGKIAGYYSNDNYFYQNNGPQYLQVYAASIESVDEVVKYIEQKEFIVQSHKDYIDNLLQIFGTVEIIFCTIGGVLLLIAIISIMNTISMTVYERRSSIGRLKVLGASNKTIRSLFMTEGAWMAFLGWLYAIPWSLFNVVIINIVLKNLLQQKGFFTQESISIPIWLMFLLLVLVQVITALAVYFPARRAAKLPIIQSLNARR